MLFKCHGIVFIVEVGILLRVFHGPELLLRAVKLPSKLEVPSSSSGLLYQSPLEAKSQVTISLIACLL
jgi:hypothetical protein